MSGFQYKVVPFAGTAKGSATGSEIATQLQSAISVNTNDGWVFHSFNKVSVAVEPGCLAGLLGGKTAYQEMDQLVFVKAL